MRREKRSERVSFHITYSEGLELDRMAEEGGFRNRNELARSMIRAVIDDDRKAHNTEQEVRPA